MKILAIGANGVIGKATVSHLQQEHEVIAVGGTAMATISLILKVRNPLKPCMTV